MNHGWGESRLYPHQLDLTRTNRRQERRRLRAALRRAARRTGQALDRRVIGLGAWLRALLLLPMGGSLEPNGDGTCPEPRIERADPTWTGKDWAVIRPYDRKEVPHGRS